MVNSTTSTAATAGTTGTTTSTVMNPPLTTPTTPPSAGLGGVFGSIMPLLLVLLAFYFIIMRPQQKRENRRQEMINAMKRGDKIVTTGGIIGVVHKVISENEISLQVSEDMRIRILKSAVANVLDKSSTLGKSIQVSEDNVQISSGKKRGRKKES